MHIYIRVVEDGCVVVSAPEWVGDEVLARHVAEKAEWIEAQHQRIAAWARPVPRRWEEGVHVWLWGRDYPVLCLKASRNRLEFDGELFLFHCRDAEGLGRNVERFYRRVAQASLPPMVEAWSETMGLKPTSLHFRRTRRRLGYCDAHNRITLNTALVRYDWELVEYIVVHELAHIRYKHHRPEFWRLVARYIPDYAARRRRLV